ncbi:MAG: (d)CMP kinase [Actinomycetota bacterium]|nr:(d)CMP kinase [Actinomycetota bacterium]
MTIIAIDGPAGAGKTAVARSVAEALGWDHVNTGAMYREVALEVLLRGIDPGDEDAVEELARLLAPSLGSQPNPADKEDRLREPDVSRAASVVARNPGVRRALAERQRILAHSTDVVMEGRDIGTVVAPDAEVKLYLTASREVRAARRRRQLRLPDDERTAREVETAIAERDHADEVRELSPLTPAPTAIVLDSTDQDLGTVVAQALRVIREQLGAR